MAPRAYHGLDELLDRLIAVRRRRRVVAAVTAVLAAATAVLAAVLAAGAIGGYWPGQPPALLRWALLIGCAALGAAALAWPVLRILRSRQNLAQTARFIEQADPKVHNDFINAVLLAEDEAQVSPLLVQLALHESVLRARRAELAKTVSLRWLSRWAVAAVVAGAAVTAFAALRPVTLHRGLAAMLNPVGYVPAANRIRLLSLTPGDATIFAGQDVAIAVKVADGVADGATAAVLIDGRAEPLPMAANEDGTFSLILPRVDGTTRYAVMIGQNRWPDDKPFYTITVLEGVKVASFSIRYDYPAYTGLKPKTVEQADGTVQAPVGSRATISLTVSAAPGQAVLELKDGQATPLALSPDGKTFTAALAIQKDAMYRIVLRDARGAALQQLPDASAAGQLADVTGPAAQAMLEGYFLIRALPDQPPTVEFLAPNRDVSLRPGAALAVKIKAADDFGLTSAALLAGKEGQPPRTIREFAVTGKSQAVLDHRLTLDSSLRDGDVLVYYATATDNRKGPEIGEPQTTTSAKFKVTVAAAATMEEPSDTQRDLRDKLLAILRLQETQRVATETCLRTFKTVGEVTAAGAKIADGQQKIHGELAALVEKFPWTAELSSAKTVCAALAANEAALAVAQAKVVAALTSLDGREQACPALAGTQNRILRQLQALLAILPTLQSPELATGQPGGDLPPDVRDKLAKLQEAMEELLAAQRKAIEAATMLAKKPLDAFTPEDEKLLADLRAVQDQWDKFLNEAFADFSKLAQQDFSNPVLLQELISVKSDITMAKDALAAKAVEVATALEDNGIENAKTLTANIEKWLPDEPDRKKWSMEDANSQTNIEQAELPSELEDLVGDLLEQEEELFEEMEDLTGKYASSLDKGAGWNASDGPISNMNAQGVTGNQLPNTTELSGRSGEGRTGKSSGEYVENKAVGKGGRQTPTRLGNEPFQKGQVNDTSGESPGGATGGGKVSGSGAEGLEGPVPPAVANEMKRLAGQQAMLVHKAERLQQGFKPGDYSYFQFLQAVTLMNRVKNDLEANRYANVLRARHVTVETLGQAQAALAGGVVVQTDTSSAMPKYIRDRVTDAISGPMPEEYRDVLEQYYRRLAGQ
jgi:hypothetical protein